MCVCLTFGCSVRFGPAVQLSADYLRSDLINHCIDHFGLVWFALLWVRMKFDRNRTPSCLSVLLNQHCASALLSSSPRSARIGRAIYATRLQRLPTLMYLCVCLRVYSKPISCLHKYCSSIGGLIRDLITDQISDQKYDRRAFWRGELKTHLW